MIFVVPNLIQIYSFIFKKNYDFCCAKIHFIACFIFKSKNIGSSSRPDLEISEFGDLMEKKKRFGDLSLAKGPGYYTLVVELRFAKMRTLGVSNLY